ncbi:MAG: VCBS repeat-containing protein [Planctomycetes bacterium]|nr:VCBS repeat-containing protein [Planctomycetota bacterium]MBI3843615.1 VCBS repeat-containing protein [Planctomycetota bacterium]
MHFGMRQWIACSSTIAVILGVGIGLRAANGCRPSDAPASPAPKQSDTQPKPATLEFVMSKEGLPQKGEWRGMPAVGDLNEDGHLDFAASIRKGDGLHVFLGNGKGGFTDAKPGFNRYIEYGGSAIADLNKDGHLDIAFTTHGTPMQVFLGDGKGGFKASTEGIKNGDILEGVAVGDVDEDGNPDIVSLAWSGGGFYVFLGDGKGVWKQTRPITTTPERDYGHEVILKDMNGDGHLDIVATYGGPSIFVGDGKGHFKPWGKGLPQVQTWGICHNVAVGDVNGDGKPDLAVTGVAGIDELLGLSVYLQGADGVFTASNAGLPTDLTFKGVRFGDLDGDGKIDLVAQGGPDRKTAVYIWRGDGAGHWTQAAMLTGVGDTSEIVLADFNEDKALDILEVYMDAPGGIRLWLNRRGEASR